MAFLFCSGMPVTLTRVLHHLCYAMLTARCSIPWFRPPDQRPAASYEKLLATSSAEYTSSSEYTFSSELSGTPQPREFALGYKTWIPGYRIDTKLVCRQRMQHVSLVQSTALLALAPAQYLCRHRSTLVLNSRRTPCAACRAPLLLPPLVAPCKQR
jgi:hypothetical protein